MGAKKLDDLALAERIAWLRGVALFREIADLPGAIETFAQMMESHHYDPHVAIVNEGDADDAAYFLVTGTVAVQKTTVGGERFAVALLDAQGYPFFGEAALLHSDRRSATIFTETACHCLILRNASFARVCRERPEWALPVVMRIAGAVVERLRRSNEDLTMLYHALVNEVKGWNG